MVVPAGMDAAARGKQSESSTGSAANVVHEPMTGVLRGDFTLPGLSLAADRDRVGLDGLTGSFDLVEALPFVYVGRVDSAVASMNMTQPGAESVLVTDLRLSSESSCEGERRAAACGASTVRLRRVRALS